MCSYCGCEAGPSIGALTDDHAAIAGLASRVRHALDSGQADVVRSSMAELTARFRSHSRKEEAGLLAELARTGEAVADVERLLADHNRLRPLLAAVSPGDQPDRLRAALDALEEHTRNEDDVLYPFALQVLPAESWAQINDRVVLASGIC